MSKSPLLKAAILVDEINAMSQFHQMGIEGIRPWKVFYQAIEQVLQKTYTHCKVDFRIYGAIIPRSIDERSYKKRTGFFKALRHHGIIVNTDGICVPINGVLQEKGVDMSLGLDIMDCAAQGYQLLFVFSADADLMPAIKKAQRTYNTKVVAINNGLQPFEQIERIADQVVRVDEILKLIPSEYIIRRDHTKKPVIA